MVQFNNIKHAIDALKANTSMQEISLKDEEIEQSDFDKFVKALKENTVLKILDLSHCNLGSIDYTGLITALENKEGVSLNLSHNELTDDGSYDIETGLTNYPLQQLVKGLLGLKITSLNLSDNDIRGEVGKIIAQALKGNTTLDSLDLMGNPDISDEECEYIGKILEANKSKKVSESPQSEVSSAFAEEQQSKVKQKKKSGVEKGLRY